jgi:O-antigen/teichoic acid export membrane protein
MTAGASFGYRDALERMRVLVTRRERGAPSVGAATRGLLWLLAQTASGRAVTFLGQIVLARLLSPDDFGSIGLTYTITAVIGSLTASGIGDVLLQRSKTFLLWAWPALWIELGLTSVGAVLTLALAPLGASFYSVHELTGLASVLAISLPLYALSTIPLTAIRVSLNFKLLATVGMAEALAIQFLSVLFAWRGRGAYSFAVPVPIVAALKAVLLWMIVWPHVPRGRPRRAWFYLVRSGFWMWGVRLLIGLVSQGDYVILGSLVSRQEVGYYFFAFRLSGQPLQALASNVVNVVFPLLTRSRTRPGEQLQATLKASQLLAATLFFAAPLQATLTSPVLHLLFHDRWDPSIPLIQALSFGLALDAVAWIAMALIAARGEFRALLICALIATPWFFVLVGIGAWLGQAFGAAIAVACYYAILCPAYSYVAMKREGVSAAVILRLYLLPMALAGVAVLTAFTSERVLFGNNHPLVEIVFTLACATACYAELLRRFMPETYSAIMSQTASIFSMLPIGRNS